MRKPDARLGPEVGSGRGPGRAGQPHLLHGRTRNLFCILLFSAFLPPGRGQGPGFLLGPAALREPEIVRHSVGSWPWRFPCRSPSWPGATTASSPSNACSPSRPSSSTSISGTKPRLIWAGNPRIRTSTRKAWDCKSAWKYWLPPLCMELILLGRKGGHRNCFLAPGPGFNGVVPPVRRGGFLGRAALVPKKAVGRLAQPGPGFARPALGPVFYLYRVIAAFLGGHGGPHRGPQTHSLHLLGIRGAGGVAVGFRAHLAIG